MGHASGEIPHQFSTSIGKSDLHDSGPAEIGRSSLDVLPFDFITVLQE